MNLVRHVNNGRYLFQAKGDYFYRFRYGGSGGGGNGSQRGDSDELTFSTGLSSYDTHSITHTDDDGIAGVGEQPLSRLQPMARTFS